MKIKLSQWAKKNSLSYTAAYNLYKANKIPGLTQLESGTILVEVPGETAIKVVCAKTGRSFIVSTDVDLDTSGLPVESRAEIRSAVARLGNIIAEKMGYDLGQPVKTQKQQMIDDAIAAKEKAMIDCMSLDALRALKEGPDGI